MGMIKGQECGEVDCQYPELGKDCPCGIAGYSNEDISKAKQHAKDTLLNLFEKYEVNISDRLRVNNAFVDLEEMIKGRMV